MDKIKKLLHDNISVDVIENDKKAKKSKPDQQQELIDILKCKNDRCIISVERGLKQICILKDKEKAVYRCKYCEAEV
ncbi:MAG: hypothetical protein J6A89_05775 [Clostridia bacterium]|nr:hypothetical protein [Clostridia bacterium]